MSTIPVEVVVADGITLAYVIRAEAAPERTTFVTGDDANLQVGFVVYPAGGEVQPHEHLPVEREIVGTAEVLFVRTGRCQADLYDGKRERVETIELAAGDTIVLLAGGHGFRMVEDTVLLEVKQGPYIGLAEKERFS